MFFVFNKEKIFTYVISVCTVVLLFFIANNSTEKITETTSNIESNICEENNSVNNIVK